MALSLFNHATAIPSTMVDGDTSGYTLGVSFVVKVAGTIDAISFYRNHLDPTVSRDVAIFARGDGGVYLRKGTSSSEVMAAGWVTVPLSSPFSVTPGTQYKAAVTMYGQHYAATAGYFNVGAGGNFEDANFNLHATSDLTYGSNGLFEDNGTGITEPTNSFNGTNYYVDISFTPDSEEAPTTKPLATMSIGMSILC